MIRAEALHLGLSVLNGQFHCDPLTLPIAARGCFGNAFNSLFWRWVQGADLGARPEVAPTSPLLYLRYMTLISLGSNLGSLMEAAGICQVNPDLEQLKNIAQKPPPRQTPKS